MTEQSEYTARETAAYYAPRVARRATCITEYPT